MTYCLHQAAQKLWRHALVYAAIALQIAVGTAVITCSMNYTGSINAYAKHIHQ